MPSKLHKHLFRYGLVGVIGTLLDLGVLYILVEFAHFPILLGASCSFGVAVINNFVLNKVWTFENQEKNYKTQFIKFLLVSLIGLALTNGLMFLFVNIMAIWYLFAKILTSAVVVVWNFTLNKLWTFAEASLMQSLHKHPTTLELSVIVPSYNEEKRIESSLRKILKHLRKNYTHFEVLVVDDGSEDKTNEQLERLCKEFHELRTLSLPINKGKGKAVKEGVLLAQGELILFTDADNASPIEELDKLIEALDPHSDLVIGSRFLKGSNIEKKQPWYRVFIGRLGNKLIQIFFFQGIHDTQCGFKLFRSKAAKDIFKRQKINRWGFDVETLFLAFLLNYKVKEIPIHWMHVPGSRLRPIRDGFKTIAELGKIKWYFWTGRYKIPQDPHA